VELDGLADGFLGAHWPQATAVLDVLVATEPRLIYRHQVRAIPTERNPRHR